jgi:hypothetical protein
MKADPEGHGGGKISLLGEVDWRGSLGQRWIRASTKCDHVEYSR